MGGGGGDGIQGDDDGGARVQGVDGVGDAGGGGVQSGEGVVATGVKSGAGGRGRGRGHGCGRGRERVERAERAELAAAGHGLPEIEAGAARDRRSVGERCVEQRAAE